MRTRNAAFQEGNKVQIPAVGPQTDLSQWKIRKVLAEPDVALNRMFKFTRAEAEHVLCSIGSDKVEKAREGEDLRVKMVDLDTGSQHELSFRKVRRGSVFGFKLGWVTHFVVRRRLKVGDQIGMYVDPSSSMFYFCVLSRASAEN
ncbi:hypothetical protein L484_000028 [Morus notabilis]|uniref:TF-B3 domain-containing protein n=1 Tax=Morus notabilis TaxID=981085 RepID=W9SF36_9ROSA|nr:putative B3 domain-containing protein At1g78640 [Morus notabilis]EXC62368.1 hypothetical protein L484_000028 [Morus notabilis]